MTDTNAALMSTKKNQLVATMYFIGVGLLLIQIALGGITRLTGSGLSITSWDVITGTIPPLNEVEWQEEFTKYQTTPQYAIINSHFTLADFKFIFFWEWVHRFWGRLVGLVCMVFILILWRKKYIDKEISNEFVTLFFMGILQALIGWIMVKSGLTGDAIYVKPSKLAFHFCFAVILIGTIWWYAVKHFCRTVPRIEFNVRKHTHYVTLAILALTSIQLILGCFMAGTRSAAVASTWPSINGSWIPDNLINNEGIYNGITIHFFHRNLAYVLALLTAYWTLTLFYGRRTNHNQTFLYMPIGLIFLQMILGIGCVFFSPYIIPNGWGNFEWSAQLHQLVALIFVLIMLVFLYLFYHQAHEPAPRS